MSTSKRWAAMAMYHRYLWHFFTSILFVLVLLHTSLAQARPLFAAIAIDGYTGKVVHSRNADSLRYPASLTKVMTLYLLFRELKAGRITKSTRLHVSSYAASKPPSKLGLRAGSRIRVEQAILALVTKSANDVATVIAEALAGSEKAFAKRMTRTAHELGMSRTTFRNASGLPDKRQRTTARDMSKLAQRIQRDFPQYYHYFRVRSFRYGKRVFRNHNKLLGRFRGTDGIKTGYTRASGFNLLTSVSRGKKKVIAVVLGGRTGRARDSHMKAIVSHAFTKVSKFRPRKRRVIPLKPVPLPARKPQPPANKGTSNQSNDLAATQLKSSIHPKGATVYASVTPISLDQLPPLQPSDAKAKKTAMRQIPTDRDNKIVPASSPVKPTVLTGEKHPVNLAKAGWSIQIGAFVRKDDARRLLDETQVRAKNILGSRAGFTTTFTSKDKVIYRARFAGFNKDSASDTCRALKKQAIGCYALAPQLLQ